MNTERPKVGVGVIIENSSGDILVGKRIGHAPYYSIPGGHLELGESFEEAAIKEIFEETGLTITDPEVIAVTNNLKTYRLENKHYVSIILHTKKYFGEPQLKEPDKCEAWFWVSPTDLPQPHFDASEWAVESFLKKVFYIRKSEI